MDNSVTSQNSSKNGKKTGLRAAVNKHCRSCIYDELEPGTWRKQVEQCTVKTCDLFPFRPHSYKKYSVTNNEEIIIKSHGE